APRAADGREDEVRVAGARAVSGEVLPAGEHAGPPEPARQRDAQAGDPRRVGPEGAVADHAVARVGPDVEHRGEVEVDADRAQLVPHGAADRLGEAGVAPRAHHGGGREMRERPRQPVDTPALVVERDQRAHPGAAVAGAAAAAGRARRTAVASGLLPQPSMRPARRPRRPSEAGIAMAIALFTLMVFIVLAATSSLIASSDVRATRDARGGSQAHFV